MQEVAGRVKVRRKSVFVITETCADKDSRRKVVIAEQRATGEGEIKCQSHLHWVISEGLEDSERRDPDEGEEGKKGGTLQGIEYP